MSTNISLWDAVPVGSTLEISVNGKKKTDVNFISDARVVPTTGSEVMVPDHEMNPGPKVLSLKKNVSYAVRLAVKFLGSTTQKVAITAQLLDSNGKALKNVDGDVLYSFDVSGKAGVQIQRATLVALAV